SNDSDPENDPLFAVLVQGPAHGSLTLNSDGSFSYTAQAGFTGNDAFLYQASDGNLTSLPATVVLTVKASNSAPVAVADSYSIGHDQVLQQDAAGGVLANDSDADGDPLWVTVVSGPANGSLTLNADGSFAYTPAQGFVGSDGFTYQVSDGTAQSTANVSL